MRGVQEGDLGTVMPTFAGKRDAGALYGWADNTDIPLLCLVIILAGGRLVTGLSVSSGQPYTPNLTVLGAYCKSMGVCKLASFFRTLVFTYKQKPCGFSVCGVTPEKPMIQTGSYIREW